MVIKIVINGYIYTINIIYRLKHTLFRNAYIYLVVYINEGVIIPKLNRNVFKLFK